MLKYNTFILQAPKGGNAGWLQRALCALVLSCLMPSAFVGCHKEGGRDDSVGTDSTSGDFDYSDTDSQDTETLDSDFDSETATTDDTDTVESKSRGFLHADGTDIVDGDGENFILRGMGFGGWMNQEPYMLGMGSVANEGQHSIFERVEELIGQENLETWHQAWLDNYCTEDDVEELADSGFNSLRLAMHYNLFTLPVEQEPVAGEDTLLDRGFDMVDKLLLWCKEHEIYLILDLHAAPGGQGMDANICDYDPDLPSLWESEENRRKTVALWGQLAKRYADETWIGGYDLLNEPNWGFDGSRGNENGCAEIQNILLKELTDAIIERIRQVDSNHMVFIEGNCWGNRHINLWPVNDDNAVLSFHRYWVDNTYESIESFLELREMYNVPLWMGESGENSDDWYFDAVELLEENNIGWAWWTWKKLDSNSGSFSVSRPYGFDTLLNYWQHGGIRPDESFAFDVMIGLAENLLIENCTRNTGVLEALTSGH